MTLPRFIGMVHLGPLPGAPRFEGDFDEVLTAAATDAEVLAEAGFDGIMVENFGDAPFFADDVPKATIAAMTAAISTVYEASRLPVGVNVLRNDALSALAVAAATQASFVRINVLSGTMYTDQGPIVGRAAEVARLRAQICPDVQVMADVFVKHATPPPGLSIIDATNDLVERAGADAVIVSGVGTGSAVDTEQLATVASVSELPIYIGSGISADNLDAMLAYANGAIVGTSIKVQGVSTNPVDMNAAAAFMLATGGR